MKLIIFFIFIPLVEFFLLFRVADVIGFWPTVLLVVSTAFIGVNLLKRQGLQTMARIQQKMQTAQMPAQEMVEGLLLFFSGGLLLTPGLITDVLGFLILIPQTRSVVANRIAPYILSQFTFLPADMNGGANPYSSPQQQGANHDGVIEGEYTEVAHMNLGSTKGGGNDE